MQTQWPAVTINRLFRMVAPQKCVPRLVKLAMYGVCPGPASIPPTIRLDRELHGIVDTREKQKNSTLDKGANPSGENIEIKLTAFLSQYLIRELTEDNNKKDCDIHFTIINVNPETETRKNLVIELESLTNEYGKML